MSVRLRNEEDSPPNGLEERADGFLRMLEEESQAEEGKGVSMDVEVIKAIGQYIVTPICIAVVLWAIFR